MLGYRQIGIDDDLLDLGADSLAALQASARLEELTGLGLSLEQFFSQATVAHPAEGAPGVRLLAGYRSGAGSGKWEEGEL